MLEKLNHSGYIKLNCKYDKDSSSNNNTENSDSILQRYYAYDFYEGQIRIYGYDGISSINGKSAIIGYDHNSIPYLFFMSNPISLPKLMTECIIHSQEVDFVVKSYYLNSKYSTAWFSFDELSCLCPATQIIKDESNDKVIVEKPEDAISSFNITVDSIPCKVELIFDIRNEKSIISPRAEAETKIKVSFPETDNLLFLKKLYQIVDNVFSFICNRRNTACISMKLSGKHPIESINKEINGKMASYESEIFFFDKYREKPEGETTLMKTREIYCFINRLEKLFQLIAQGLSNDGENAETVSISSIHQSFQKRMLIDLQQTLHITAAFEFYVRKYLPTMVVEKEHHIKMKEYLEKIENSSTGNLRKLAKRLKKIVLLEPSLEDKVLNVYNGYEGWDPLEACISEEWYRKDEINMLAKEINEWRNELAHEKKTYTPSIDTIRAVRLLEHLNYAIVLRQIGWNDDEIKMFLDSVLTRHFNSEPSE